VTICTQSCDGSTPIAGALVTIAGSPTPPPSGNPPGTPIQCIMSQPPGSTGPICCQLNVTTEGSYQLAVSADGFFTYSNTVAFKCDGTTTVNLAPSATGDNPPIQFNVFGVCGQPLAGAIVAIGGASYTTDSNGIVNVGITDPGTFPWSVSKSRFVTATGTAAISTLCGFTSNSGVVSVTLAIADGFAPAPCTSVVLADPVPTTMNLVDSIYGGAALTWNQTNPTGFN
jgi:hypothetical protein